MTGHRFSVHRLGLAVAGVAVGAFMALPALAEPPSHGFNTRPPRTSAPKVKQVKPPHAPHKAHPLLSPGTKGDHPTHEVVVRPIRTTTQPPLATAHPHNTPERLVVVKRPKEVLQHAPHVNRQPPVVNRAPAVHQPHQPRKEHNVPQVSDNKHKVTQEIIVVTPKQ